MITGDLARERIADRVREAEAFRRSRTTKRGKQLEHRAVARRAYSGFMAALAAPFRH
jgi:hypothetical protein